MQCHASANSETLTGAGNIALVGHPKYEITGGSIGIDGKNINELDPCERARLGLFLAFQYPVTIPGVKVADFLRHALPHIFRQRPQRHLALLVRSASRQAVHQSFGEQGPVLAIVDLLSLIAPKKGR